MDSKGYTVATASIGPKVITRHNRTESSCQNITFFGVVFNSWHAEMRILYYILKNSYVLKLAQLYSIQMVVERFTRAGKLAAISKPCPKCQVVLDMFSNKYKLKIDVYYRNEHKLRRLSYG